MDATRKIVSTTRWIASELSKVEGVKVVGDPQVSVVAFQSDGSFNIYALSEQMKKRGWNLVRDQQLFLTAAKPTGHRTVKVVVVVVVTTLRVAGQRSSSTRILGLTFSLSTSSPTHNFLGGWDPGEGVPSGSTGSIGQ